MVEAHLEVDTGCKLGLEPVRLDIPQPQSQERVGRLEGGCDEDGVPETDAVGEEPTRNERGGERAGRIGQVQDDLDVHAPGSRGLDESLRPAVAPVTLRQVGADAL